jgi:hypothetical protein
MASDSTLSTINFAGAVVMLIAAVLSLITTALQFGQFLADKEKILAV